MLKVSLVLLSLAAFVILLPGSQVSSEQIETSGKVAGFPDENEKPHNDDAKDEEDNVEAKSRLTRGLKDRNSGGSDDGNRRSSVLERVPQMVKEGVDKITEKVREMSRRNRRDVEEEGHIEAQGNVGGDAHGDIEQDTGRQGRNGNGRGGDSEGQSGGRQGGRGRSEDSEGQSGGRQGGNGRSRVGGSEGRRQGGSGRGRSGGSEGRSEGRQRGNGRASGRYSEGGSEQGMGRQGRNRRMNQRRAEDDEEEQGGFGGYWQGNQEGSGASRFIDKIKTGIKKGIEAVKRVGKKILGRSDGEAKGNESVEFSGSAHDETSASGVFPFVDEANQGVTNIQGSVGRSRRSPQDDGEDHEEKPHPLHVIGNVSLIAVYRRDGSINLFSGATLKDWGSIYEMATHLAVGDNWSLVDLVIPVINKEDTVLLMKIWNIYEIEEKKHEDAPIYVNEI